MSRTHALVFLAALSFSTAAVAIRAATPIEVPASGGEVALPTSGLAVALPSRDGVTLNITGQWALTQGGTAFEGRDVIDEIDAEGKLRVGTRVLIGYPAEGDARAIVKGVRLANAWEETINLWGSEWQVRGGSYLFANSLGLKPAVVLASIPGEGKPSLMLQHFLVAADSEVTKEAMLAQVKESPTMQSVFRAFRSDHYAHVLPTKSDAVMQPANSVASRIVELPKTGLRVQLPDDGFVWLNEEQPDNATDVLYLVAPRLPEITVELLVVDAPDARAAFAQLGLAGKTLDPAPANLPAGWQSGIAITTDDTVQRATVCTAIGKKVLVVEFLATSRLSDAAPYRPLLEALADAVQHPAPLPGTLAAQ